MDSFTIVISLVGLGYFLYWLLSDKRPKNYPPGPRGLPLVGNAFQMGQYGHCRGVEWAEEYGDIIGLSFGSYRFVILNDPDDIRECFNKQEFSGRCGFNVFLDENVPGVVNEGVIMSNGQKWLDLRRFSLKTLRDFGFGKRSLENIILEEANELIEELKKEAGQPIATQSVFNAAILNVVWSIIAGTRYPHDDPKLGELITLVLDFMKNAFTESRFLFFMFPSVVTLSKKFPRLFSNRFAMFRKKLFDFLGKAIDEHRATIQLGSPRDFIDTYLEEAMKVNQADPNSNFKADNNDFALKVLLMDFFLAGSETTSTTLTWALFFLALHPKVEEKLHQELTSVVGSRTVTLEDRANLPYVEATMTEIYRMSSLVALGVGHATSQDVVVKGHTIPKNTMVAGNIYGVHFNKKIWGDPRTFRPERFLSDDGKTFVRNKNVIPFSVGKRQCLGESLARDEFYIFLTNIVQQLKITMPSDEPAHSMEGRAGGVLTPEPHKIILLDRSL